ncbi:MAG: glycoside hydrolase family 9 protein [Eubacteriales bacterium]|nr:glycoside hydrolase family 9 protein [Eubacteriales bacterium]MDD3882375.1 glycoside hydrolase family 9 protein [Eubacteriales bacterium]MDD4512404.1 glycoside hydrolase family 9 protein [Eubacteriales bacterium]
MAIFLNQLGFVPGELKLAHATEGEESFEIRNAWGKAIITGRFSMPRYDEASGCTVATADFTSLEQEGQYTFISGESSASFRVAPNIYNAVGDALYKSFYYFRCGCDLLPEFAGAYAHKACHTEPAVVFGMDTKVDVSGGWHDAGDYGRYPAPGVKAVADLLYAYEMNPLAFSRPVGIPDSSSRIPDVLTEARYELEYLLKMQTAEGSVYHKSTPMRFCGMIMPEEEKEQMVLIPPDTVATADVAAVMAIACRVYEPFDSAFSDRCKQAAFAAYDYLSAHPEAVLPGRNPEGMNTGTYGDSCDKDERAWAAAAMYRLTNETKYLDESERYFAELEEMRASNNVGNSKWMDTMALGWSSMGGYVMMSVVFNSGADSMNPFYQKMRARLIAAADDFLAISKRSAFGVSLSPSDYVWGSNMNVMNNAVVLMLAYKLTGAQQYRDAAVQQWNYLLGDNPTGYCYVTGFGSKQVMHPHHRPSEADGVEAPVPGMVSGGPNAGLHDAVAKEKCIGLAPACCFVDETPSYSTNEVAIYWNSPAVLAWALMF